ncbi:hypothetical protein [Streptacidiphilus anmyonensis]|uniref:hypothetical protein n=1 Tax=Streptacidiphilus anmyonensis TaxID=405782 RepID=UPI00128DE18B|nr:hypothetical protein [Streptacidiphilus anmyonensis]
MKTISSDARVERTTAGSRKRGRLVAVTAGSALLAAIACVTAVLSFGGGSKKEQFPGALSYTSSNTTWERAFRYFRIDTGAPMGPVHYVGWLDGEGNALFAYFTIDCDAVPTFAATSSLRKVPSMYDLYGSVFPMIELFAGRHAGWKASPGDVWYSRSTADPNQAFGAVLQDVGGVCTMYIGS